MSKITTEMCKIFIQHHFSLNSDVSIKRTKKYKDEAGFVARDFILGNGKQCTLIEVDGQLQIKESDTKSDNIKRIFTDEELKTAKKFLKNCLKKMEQFQNNEDATEDDEYDINNIIEESNSLTDKSILFSQFCFCFPSETYGNEKEAVTNGLDTPFLLKGNSFANSFCFMLWDKNNSDPDLYLHDVLKDMLPEYINSCDEYHYEVDFEYMQKNNPNITVRDIKNLLLSFGLEYKKKTPFEEECLFKNYK